MIDHIIQKHKDMVTNRLKEGPWRFKPETMDKGIFDRLPPPSNATLPETMREEINSEISKNVHSRLEEKAEEIDKLAISEQELRTWAGILNHPMNGHIDVTTEALDITGDKYRLEALREVDARMEPVNKCISETAYLKADYLRIIEKGERPEHNEATQIAEQTIQENETFKDLSRLQRFKEWAKKNIVVVSALAISIAGIITTIVIGARSAIVKGAQVTSKFAKAVANIGKKLCPVLGPLLNVIAQAISWGAKGLTWLASNLWVLALAALWFICDYYRVGDEIYTILYERNRKRVIRWIQTEPDVLY